MKKDEKVSSIQMLFLLVTTVTVTGFLFVPSITAKFASRDGWISVAVGGTLFGIIVALVCTKLGLYYPDKSVVEYAPELVGRFGGKLIGLLYIFFFMHTNAIIVREFGDFLVTAFLPETPLLVFNSIVVLVAAYAVYNGMEVLCRMNQFLFPLFIAAFSFIVFLLTENISFDNFLPLMENGVKPVIWGSMVPGAWRGEILLMLMFLPFLNQPREAGKTLITAVFVIGFFLTLTAATSIAVFGPLLTQNMVFPVLELARYVSLGHFLERLEAVVIIVWVAGVAVKVAAFYLAAVLGTAQWLNIKDYRPLVYPVGIFILLYSAALFENSRELVDFLATVFAPYAYFFELIIPLGLLAVALIRKRGGQKQ